MERTGGINDVVIESIGVLDRTLGVFLVKNEQLRLSSCSQPFCRTLIRQSTPLESRVIPPDLSAAFANLTVRVEALENSTPTEPPADEDDDMKLLGTFEHTNSADISITDGFDDSLYSGYHLVISNLAIEDSDYRQKKLGIAFWNGSS